MNKYDALIQVTISSHADSIKPLRRRIKNLESVDASLVAPHAEAISHLPD